MKTICLFIFILLSIISCSKSDNKASSNIDTIVSNKSMVGCGHIDLFDDFLDHENFVSFLKCSGWQRDFPVLFDSVVQIDPEAWNLLLLPLSKHFLGKGDVRDQLFAHVKQLEVSGGLYSAEKVWKSFFKGHSIDTFKSLLVGDDNHRDARSSFFIFKLLFNSPEMSEHVNELLRYLNDVFYSDSVPLANEWKEFSKNPVSRKFRILLIDAMIGKINVGITQRDIDALKNIFSLKKGNSGEPWIKWWLNQKSVDSLKLQQFFLFPVKVAPTYLLDMQGVISTFPSGINCAEKYFLNGKEIASDYTAAFSLYNPEKLEKLSSQILSSFVMASAACPEVNNYKVKVDRFINGKNEQIVHKIDFLRLLGNTLKYLEVEEYAQVIHFLWKISEKNSPKGDLYMSEMLSGKISQAVFGMASHLAGRDEFFYQLFRIVKDIDSNAFEKIDWILSSLLEGENLEAMMVLAKRWNGLVFDDKDSLLRVLDENFSDGDAFYSLFEFYRFFVGNYRELSEEYNTNVFTSFGEFEKHYKSFVDLFSTFSSEEIKPDLIKFFSEDHLINLVKVLTSSMIIEPAHSNYPEVNTLTVESENNYVLNSKWDVNQDLLTCIDEVSTQHVTWYDLIQSVPRSCRRFSKNEIFMEILTGLESLQGELAKATLAPDNAKIVGPQGFFSSENLLKSLVNVKITDEICLKNSSNGSGVDYFLSSFKNFFFNIRRTYNSKSDCSGGVCRGYVSEVSNIFRFINEDSKLDNLNTQNIRNQTLNYFVRNHYDNLASDANFLFKRYLYKTNFKRRMPFLKNPSRMSCENYLDINSEESCPTSKTFARVMSEMVKLSVTQMSSKTPSLVSKLMTAIAPEHRIISFDKLVYLLSDITDKKYEVNNKLIFFKGKSGINSTNYSTVAQRIEIAAREVSYDGNYLGVHIINSLGDGGDYTSIVKSKVALFKLCTKFKYCGQYLTKDLVRRLGNVEENLDVLMDMKDGFPRDYSSLIMKFAKILRESSHPQSRKKGVRPISFLGAGLEIPWPMKDKIDKHQAQTILLAANNSLISNTSLYFNKILAARNMDVKDLVENKRYKRIRDYFLKGVSVKNGNSHSLIGVIEKILSSISTKKVSVGLSLIEALEREGVSFNRINQIIDVAVNFLVITSYLNDTQFQGPNIASQLVSFLDLAFEFLKNWDKIYIQYKRNRIRFSRSFDMIYQVSEYLSDMLLSNNNFESKKTMKFVNRISHLLNYMMELKSGSLTSRKIISNRLKNSTWLVAFFNMSDSVATIFERLHFDQFVASKWRLNAIYSYLIDLKNHPKSQVDIFRNYLETSSIRVMPDLSLNASFDEPYRITSFLGKGIGRNNNFQLVSKRYLYTNYESFLELINRISRTFEYTSL